MFYFHQKVEGICQDSLPAGRYEIGIHMGAVADSGLDQPTQLIAGSFDTPSRLMIEEVRLDTAVDASKLYTALNRTEQLL